MQAHRYGDNMSSQSARNGAGARVARTLTVDEALQYSPFSSIVPFGPETIPPPAIGFAGSACSFSNYVSTETSGGPLDSLNQHSNNLHTAESSQAVQQTIEQLQSLFKVSSLTEYKFKATTLPRESEDQPSNGSSSNYQGLGQFSKMLLASTEIAYGYSTPKTHVSPSKSQNPEADSSPPSKLVKIDLDNSVHISKTSRAYATSQGSPDALKIQPMIIVPELPRSSQPDEYQTFPEASTPPEDPLAKKQRSLEAGTANSTPARVDHRQKTEASLSRLKMLMEAIFEAEDNLQPDSSGVISSDAAQFFTSDGSSNTDSPIIALSVHGKLDSALATVISDGRFSDVPVGDLNRLQRLCDNSLKSAASTDLNIRGDCSEDELEQWISRVDKVDMSLRCARTALRIMTGKRPEKQLYSEELLQGILEILKGTVEDSIIPAAQARSAAQYDSNTIASQKKPLINLLNQSRRILVLLSKLIASNGIPETALAKVEYLTFGMIFADCAHSEKDSILGLQKFETLRHAAMEVLAKVFSRYSDQRKDIFNEILTSLENLPVARQSARQFKLIEGESIQLVSALIMRLVQTSATFSETDNSKKKRRALTLTNGNSEEKDATESGDEDEGTTAYREAYSINPEVAAIRNPAGTVQKMLDVSSPLADAARSNAHHVISFLVDRALKSTKSGDAPYRNLLDIFTEDFIRVLGSTDWPAAELLLRCLLTSMFRLCSEEQNSTAPAKNMALDLMGRMGSGISDLVSHVRQYSKNLEVQDSHLSQKLAHLTEDVLEARISQADLISWTGPYRMVLEYLVERNISDDAQLQSAIGYHTTQWAVKVGDFYDLLNVKDEDEDEAMSDELDTEAASLAFKLQEVILSPKWLESADKFESVKTVQGRLAHSLIVISMPFCKAFDNIFNLFLKAMSSDQATVRSKSLKSVMHLLETDVTILDRNAGVVPFIMKLIGDPSPSVRDSVIALIAKCLTLRPSLEESMYEPILRRAGDSNIGIRKRAIKLLRDIYLRNHDNGISIAIADTLLHRVRDTDEGVAELARQTFEEIWIAPHYHKASAGGDDSVQSKLALKNQLSLIVLTTNKPPVDHQTEHAQAINTQISKRNDAVSSVLESLLRVLLSVKSKNAADNFRVCMSFVATMFDDIVDNTDSATSLGRQYMLHTLTIFARANPKLFQPDQLRHLQPYIENLSSNDDLQIYRSSIIIFRCVLPHFSSVHSTFLSEVQNALFRSVSKLNKRELTEVISCLWTINGVLNNPERLSRVTISCLQGMYKERTAEFSEGSQKLLDRVRRYLVIAGLFGKYCNFEGDQVKLFRQAFPSWKGDSVSGLMIDIFSSFTSPKRPLLIRKAALEGFCSICQTWPKLFLKEQVYSAFDIVFSEGDQDLENLVLSGFREYLQDEEKLSEKGSELSDGESEGLESGRLSTIVTANQNDGVTTSIAQRYLAHIIRIATKSQDAYALTAVEVIASVNRQGLVHPKECGPVLVALETSQNPNIASIAFREHRTLHEKHETILEKEYMKAVQQAFVYQRDTVGDPLGATMHPFTSKLRPLFDVIKISKGKIRKKFLSNLCMKIDFDPIKLDVENEPPKHLEFSRFIIDNLAFFEYNSVEELIHTISIMEKIVTATGTGIAHAIETEVLRINLDPAPERMNQEYCRAQPEMTQPQPGVSPARMRQLTTSAMILSALWDTRTYLRRLYGLSPGTAHKEGKGKSTTKDLNKVPVKTSGITAEDLWRITTENMSSLETKEKMVIQCREFVELLTIDKDIKIAADGDDGQGNTSRLSTPSDDEGSNSNPATPGSSGRQRKRKSASATPGGRAKKQRTKSNGGKASKDAIQSDEDAPSFWD